MKVFVLFALFFLAVNGFPGDPVILNKSDIYSATVSCYSGLLVRENSQVYFYEGTRQLGFAKIPKAMQEFHVKFDVTTGPHPRLKFVTIGTCDPNVTTTANLSLHQPRQQNHVNIVVRDTLDAPIILDSTVNCSHGPIYLNSTITLSETCVLSDYDPRMRRVMRPIPIKNSNPPMAKYSFYIQRRHEATLRAVISTPPYCYITFDHVCRTNDTVMAVVELENNKFFVRHLEVQNLPLLYQVYECAKFGPMRTPRPQTDYFQNGEKLWLNMTGKLKKTNN